MSIEQLSVTALKLKLDQQEPLLLLDVREPNEYAFAHIEGSVLIPLQQIPLRWGELDRAQAIAVICHHGRRSQQAADYLAGQGFDHLYNVSGGIDAWSQQCDASVARY